MKDFERDHETGEALIHEILEKCQPGRLRKFTWVPKLRPGRVLIADTLRG